MNGKMSVMLSAVVALACGGGVEPAAPGADPAQQGVAIAISPLVANVATGGTVAFGATVTGTADASVSWSVEEGAAGGTVSAAGLYSAPPTAGSYHVLVASAADATRTARATVNVAAAAPVDPTLRTVQQWESLFLQGWEAENTNTYLPYSTSKNSWKFYNLAYAIDGLTAMFEATGNTRYLDRVLLYVENVIAGAAPSSSLPASQYKDGYLGWGAWDHPTDPSINGGEYPLYESYCFRYVGELLRAMRDDPAVYGDAAYRKRYDAILAFMKVNVFDKWVSRGVNANVYRVNTHMAAHWAFISLDLWALTADPAERARYRTVLDNIDLHLPNYPSSLRQQMRPHPSDPSAYTWSSAWGSTTPVQDVSHGNGVVAFVVEANRLGVEWTAADMQMFARTLGAHVWPASGQYALYVDGSGSGNGWFNDGFCKLGRYDAALQKRLEQHTVGRGMQLYGNGALNAKILSGR